MPVKLLLRKTSLVDFPGCVSAVFFFPGCNLRCPWCHNRELVSGGAEGFVTLDEALAHIKKRRFVLGGVVLSGGEPCLCGDLPFIIGAVKKSGLKVKLDTNGTFPAMLEKLFRLDETRPDYVALDLKTAPERYVELLAAEKNTGQSLDHPGERLKQSAALLRGSGIEREYRTLALPRGFIGEKDIEALAPLADDAPWYFRPFRGGNCLDPEWNSLDKYAAQGEAEIQALAAKARNLGKNGIARHA